MKTKILGITAALVMVSAGLLLSTTIAGEEEREELENELQEMAEHREMIEQHLETLELMSDVAFSPEKAALISIGALKDEMDMEPGDRIKALEGILKTTETLGLRNAIRFNLKDLYLDTEQRDKATKIVIETIRESDIALAEEGEEDQEEDWDDEEDEDEEEETID